MNQHVTYAPFDEVVAILKAAPFVVIEKWGKKLIAQEVSEVKSRSDARNNVLLRTTSASFDVWITPQMAMVWFSPERTAIIIIPCHGVAAVVTPLYPRTHNACQAT